MDEPRLEGVCSHPAFPKGPQEGKWQQVQQSHHPFPSAGTSWCSPVGRGQSSHGPSAGQDAVSRYLPGLSALSLLGFWAHICCCITFSYLQSSRDMWMSFHYTHHSTGLIVWCELNPVPSSWSVPWSVQPQTAAAIGTSGLAVWVSLGKMYDTNATDVILPWELWMLISGSVGLLLCFVSPFSDCVNLGCFHWITSVIRNFLQCSLNIIDVINILWHFQWQMMSLIRLQSNMARRAL